MGAVSIGVGGMVGGGIFAVLGLAAELSGGATPLAFLIAGIVALLTGYSYAKLSVSYPSKGGTVIFVDKAFGVDFFTGSVNNLLWVGYIVTLSLYAFAFGSYATTFLPENLQTNFSKHILISVGIILPTILNFLSSSVISKAETYIVSIKIAILLLIVFAGFSSVNTIRFSPSGYKPLFQIIGGGMIIFVAYEGFELIANTASNIKDYKKNLPKAYYISIIFVMLLYILIAFVTVGSLTPDQIKTARDFALAQAAKPSLGQFGFVLVAIAAILATLSAINATLYGSARLSYVIATEGELPEFLEDKIWNQPVVGLVITSILALFLSNLADLSSISTMGSAGFLIVFLIVNAASFIKAREIKSSRFISLLGVLLCFFALVALFWHTFETSPSQIWVLIVMVLISFLIEVLYILFWKVPEKKGRIRLKER